MRAEVRDDIIKLETFVDIKFKYEKYIDMIHEAGGYCFLNQFAYHYGNNEGRYIAKQLEDAGLIKTKAISNYKYCYLTDAVIKYLKLKDSEEDYEDKSKSQINVKRLSTTPSDKVLFASAIKFALMNNDKYKFIGKIYYEEKIVEGFSECYECKEEVVFQLEEEINKLKIAYKKEVEEANKILRNHIKPLFELYNTNTGEEYKSVNDKISKLKAFIEEKSKSILHIKRFKEEEEELIKLKIRLGELAVINKFKESLVKQKNDLVIKLKGKNNYIQKKERELEILNLEKTKKDFKVEESVKKSISYYDKSKIIFTLSNKCLNMIIIDTGSLKNSYGYMDVLNKFSKETETEKLNKKIYIASYSEKRGKRLKEQLEKILIEKENKIKKIGEYNRNIDMSKYTPDFYKNAEKFIKRVPNFETYLIDNAHYIEPYKEPLSSKIGYIKPKDKDRFEEIKNKLNNR